jgi:hypothetical protein
MTESVAFRYVVEEALRSSSQHRSKEVREVLEQVTREYLRHVDANLILAAQMSVPFHDWEDFQPFYSAKLLGIGREYDHVVESRSQLDTLFSVSFPELAVTSPASLLRILNDQRLGALRELVASALAGEVKFDEEFARRTLLEVFRISERTTRWRRVAGYATMPLNLIPAVGTLADIAAGIAIDALIDARSRRDHRWFYVLSDVNLRHEPHARTV